MSFENSDSNNLNNATTYLYNLLMEQKKTNELLLSIKLSLVSPQDGSFKSL